MNVNSALIENHLPHCSRLINVTSAQERRIYSAIFYWIPLWLFIQILLHPTAVLQSFRLGMQRNQLKILSVTHFQTRNSNLHWLVKRKNSLTFSRTPSTPIKLPMKRWTLTKSRLILQICWMKLRISLQLVQLVLLSWKHEINTQNMEKRRRMFIAVCRDWCQWKEEA